MLYRVIGYHQEADRKGGQKAQFLANRFAKDRLEGEAVGCHEAAGNRSPREVVW